jgi:hypothetical protein
MARSLRIALQHIATIQSVLKENGYPSQQALAVELKISLSTVKNFFSGQFIDCLNFIRISQKLNLEWRAIAHRELETQPQGLSAEQHSRLKKKAEKLQREWELWSDKVGLIRESLAIETNAAEKFKLGQTLLYDEAEVECLEHELSEIEAALEIASHKSNTPQTKNSPPVINNSKPMNLTATQRREFSEALMDAFPRENNLEMMLSYELDWTLAQIAGGDNYQNIVFNLIKYAESQGEVKKLLEAAKRSNPGNPKLDNFYKSITVKKKQAPPLKPKTEETSPFITGSPITDPRHFFGRNHELRRLFNFLKHHPLQNIAIIGKPRIGKTSLLHYLKNITTTPPEQLRPSQKYDWLPYPENYQWIFVDFQNTRMQSREGLLKYILGCLGIQVPTPCDLDRFMEVVSDNLDSRTVILLDEIGVGLKRCPELDDGFWESLRSLATNYTRGNLAFVLATYESPIELARNTGHSSPFFNIFGYTATLGALTEAEARELIASSPIIFAEEDVKWILQQSQSLPLLLQILCRERLSSVEDGEIDDWRDEGLQQIEPFAHLLERNRER